MNSFIDNPSILFSGNNAIKFLPNSSMSYHEKVNAIMRFSIYYSILATILFKNKKYIYVPLFILVASFIIKVLEIYDINFLFSYDDNEIKEVPIDTSYQRENSDAQPVTSNDVPPGKEGLCVPPSNDNPFGNFNQISRQRDRARACDHREYEQDINEKLSRNLYRDSYDIYDRNHSGLRMYTMPVTTAINDQTGFAKSLYFNTPGGSCKENQLMCASRHPFGDLRYNRSILIDPQRIN